MWRRTIQVFISIVIAVAIMAAGVTIFILPNNFLIGGATGIGRILVHYIGLSNAMAVGIVNVSLFLIGLFFLGWKFAATTVLGSFLFPVFLGIMESVIPAGLAAEDRLLSAIFGGVLLGIGVALCVSSGGSSGGSDVLAVIMKEKFKVPVAVSVYVIDFLILLSQCLFASVPDVLYGIVVTLSCSIAMNKALMLGNTNVQFMIISGKYEKIQDVLQNKVETGVTLLHGKTGYYGREQEVIICTVDNRRIKKVREAVLGIDPFAFIMMNNVSEVNGRGFSLAR